jgi:hypothetical protein
VLFGLAYKPAFAVSALAHLASPFHTQTALNAPRSLFSTAEIARISGSDSGAVSARAGWASCKASANLDLRGFGYHPSLPLLPPSVLILNRGASGFSSSGLANSITTLKPISPECSIDIGSPFGPLISELTLK